MLDWADYCHLMQEHEHVALLRAQLEANAASPRRPVTFSMLHPSTQMPRFRNCKQEPAARRQLLQPVGGKSKESTLERCCLQTTRASDLAAARLARAAANSARAFATTESSPGRTWQVRFGRICWKGSAASLEPDQSTSAKPAST